jgi:hypothetical protein
MTEIEIRVILARLCRELDARKARIASAAAVGGSLVLASGCGGEVVNPGPAADAGITEASADSGADANDAGLGDAAVDQGPLPPYMAPDSGPTPDYMAADTSDDGPTPVYMSACAPAHEQDPVV